MKIQVEVEHGDGCPGPDRSSPNGDLSWLLHRAAQRIRVALDAKAVDAGLSSFRDWIVLAALATGERRTQLAIGSDVGLDKTTLTAVLDRLERGGFVVRNVDPHDRRVRVPEATEKGLAVHKALQGCRDGIEELLLDGISPEERQVFRAVLTKLAVGGADPVHGSCM